jgi:hypothetical protein
VNIRIKANLDIEHFPDEMKAYTEIDAMARLKEENPDYFDPSGAYMARSDSVHGESLENRGFIAEGTPNPKASGIGGRVGMKVPWLKPDDILTAHWPVRPSITPEYYPEDEEIPV